MHFFLGEGGGFEGIFGCCLASKLAGFIVAMRVHLQSLFAVFFLFPCSPVVAYGLAEGYEGVENGSMCFQTSQAWYSLCFPVSLLLFPSRLVDAFFLSAAGMPRKAKMIVTVSWRLGK